MKTLQRRKSTFAEEKLREARLRAHFSHRLADLAVLRGCKDTAAIFALARFLDIHARKGIDFEVWPVEEENVSPPRPFMHYNPMRVERLFVADAARRLKGDSAEEDTAVELAGIGQLAGRI